MMGKVSITIKLILKHYTFLQNQQRAWSWPGKELSLQVAHDVKTISIARWKTSVDKPCTLASVIYQPNICILPHWPQRLTHCDVVATMLTQLSRAHEPVGNKTFKLWSIWIARRVDNESIITPKFLNVLAQVKILLRSVTHGLNWTLLHRKCEIHHHQKLTKNSSAVRSICYYNVYVTGLGRVTLIYVKWPWHQ